MLPYSSTHYDAVRREWSGPEKKPIYNEATTLAEVMYETLRKNPQKVIQIHDVTGESMTCQELMESAEILSKYLVMELDLKLGDVVGLYGRNTSHVVTVVLSSLLCGTPVNALHYEFDKETASSLYKVSRPKVLFCDVENYDVLCSVNEELSLGAPIILLNGHAEGARDIKDVLCSIPSGDNKDFRYPCLRMHGNETAVLTCSSGTTGPPKCVRVSNRALLNFDLFMSLKATSVIFSFSTLYWISGIWILFASLVNGSLRVITDKPFKPEYFLDLVKRHQVTHIVANVGHLTQVSLLRDVQKTRESLANVDTIVAGGAKVPLVAQEKMHQILSNNRQRPGFMVGYGMSEVGSGISITGKFRNGHTTGTEGRLMANITIKIVDANDEALKPNELGEICISTPYPWAGYYNDPEATQKILRGNWLYTGDIGYLDDDNLLHLCAREKDIFKSQNFQICPQIIEDIVMRVQGVSQVCVFGIPDVLTSHLIACAVVRSSTPDGRNLEAQAIEAYVKENIGSMYHLSGGVYFVDDIPKTGSGKTQRNKVLDVVMNVNQKT